MEIENLTVSDHALTRFMERFKPFQLKHLESEIKRIPNEGVEIRYRQNVRALINNDFVEARYFLFKQLVAVIVENKIVTVMTYISERWEKVHGENKKNKNKGRRG